MSRLLSTLLQSARVWRLRLAGAEIDAPEFLGSGIDCRPGFQQTRGVVRIGSGAHLDCGVVLHAYGGAIRLGRHVFLGPYTVIYGHGGVEIGEHSLVAMHCRIVSSNHIIPSLGATIRSQPDELRPTRIGRDVWLGAGVTILGGVTIGDGCVVGAGAVVAHDLPAGSVSAGVPARVVRSRPT